MRNVVRRLLPFKTRLLEYLMLDSRLSRAALSAVMSLAALAAYLVRRFRAAIDLAMTLDRGAYRGPVPRLLRAALAAEAPADPRWLRRLRSRVATRCRSQITHQQPQPHTRRFFESPEAMLGPLVMVLKAASPDEKGVIVLLYSHALPLFGHLFDLDKVASRYHIVLEPSWAGYCNPDVLCYRFVDSVVFVQASEPRDREFIDGLRSNLVWIPAGNNSWVDHRIFTPLPQTTKDFDVIMVAGWAVYKRHPHFFQALQALRRQGIRLKVALVGYSLGLTAEGLRQIAADHRVDDQIEWFEDVTQADVNQLLNRAKVNVLWSRKEGANRAIIEGMFAGVPCIMRSGFNYGFDYPYINEATGRFASEDELPDALSWMVDNYRRFDPRSWVMEHMSCQRSTAVLERTMREHLQERWTTPVAVKANGLHGMHYWNADDTARFAADYQFLTSAINVRRGP